MMEHHYVQEKLMEYKHADLHRRRSRLLRAKEKPVESTVQLHAGWNSPWPGMLSRLFRSKMRQP
ncbi:hypothetical protein FHS19_001781 [Paenibacillus rhizosphaerae]|uniref:Uncharacterized protein n=1 Tax=Paenibacillus rhizosphaerae TaxID=297318 RepID=A0A839TQV4_9BACL|nr:hypothetical protein [Paenibacillus rhizosphaerae]MBB3127127.1 hypothetical protein [Paenibacillus rhizosphaerae]